MQAESTRGDLPRHHAVGLDRVTGAVEPSADRRAGGAGEPDHAADRARRREGGDGQVRVQRGYVTITVKTTAAGQLTPGFHGMHIHSVGKCEPNSVAPTGGAPGDFNSAGGHFQAAGHTGIRPAATWRRCRSARTAARSW